MKTTVGIREAQTQWHRLMREVEDGETIAISKRDETVAYLIPRARFEAIVETLEIMANPAAMKAIRQDKAGKLKFHPLSALDEDAR
jgi:prevent-host-death family protein